MTPGIRSAGAKTDDQRRYTSPTDAIRHGADLLVVGRPITRATDPRGCCGDRRRVRRGALPGKRLLVESPAWARKGKAMPPPELSDEQRAKALAKAAEARKVRAEVKGLLKMGSLGFAKLLERADSDEIVAGLKVSAVPPRCRVPAR